MADPVSSLANVLAIITATLKSCKIVYTTVRAVKDAPEHVKRLATYVEIMKRNLETIKRILGNLDSMAQNPRAGRLDPSQEKCYECITEFANEIKNDVDGVAGILERAQQNQGRLQKLKKAWLRNVSLDNDVLENMERSTTAFNVTLSLLRMEESYANRPEDSNAHAFDGADEQMARNLLKDLGATKGDAKAPFHSLTDAFFVRTLKVTDRRLGSATASKAASTVDSTYTMNAGDGDDDDGLLLTQFTYKAEMDLASQAEQRHFPDVAAIHYKKAIQLRQQLPEASQQDARAGRSIELDTKYISTLFLCVDHQQGVDGEAHLSKLAREVKRMRPGVDAVEAKLVRDSRWSLGKLYLELLRYKEAIEYLQLSLMQVDLENEQPGEHSEANVIVKLLLKDIRKAYEGDGDIGGWMGYHKLWKAKLGDDPLHESDAWADTRAWCRLHNFTDEEFERGAQLRDLQGPLFTAIKEGSCPTHVFEQLVQHHSDVGDLLVQAVRSGNRQAAQILLAKGTSAIIQQASGERFQQLLHACTDCKVLDSILNQVGRRPSIVSTADSQPTSDRAVDIRNEHGKTALHIACKRHDAGSVKVLLKHKADANATDRFGKTPMMELAQYLRPAKKSSIKIILGELLAHDSDSDPSSARQKSFTRQKLLESSLRGEVDAMLVPSSRSSDRALSIALSNRSSEQAPSL